jgi:hypothetical protein
MQKSSSVSCYRGSAEDFEKNAVSSGEKSTICSEYREGGDISHHIKTKSHEGRMEEMSDTRMKAASTFPHSTRGEDIAASVTFLRPQATVRSLKTL